LRETSLIYIYSPGFFSSSASFSGCSAERAARSSPGERPPGAPGGRRAGPGGRDADANGLSLHGEDLDHDIVADDDALPGFRVRTSISGLLPRLWPAVSLRRAGRPQGDPELVAAFRRMICFASFLATLNTTGAARLV